MTPALVALVGMGAWGQVLHRDLRRAGATVVVLVRSAASRDVALQMGAHQVVQEVEDLRGVQGVVVATPTNTHVDVLRAVSSLHVPVFVEKPLAVTAREAESAADLLGSRLSVLHVWRFHPAVVAMRAMVQTGSLGVVRGIRTTRRGPQLTHHEVDDVLNALPHDLSIVRHLLDEPPRVRWAAREPMSWPHAGAVVRLDVGDGATAVVEVSTGYASTQRTVVVVGSSASVEWDSSKPTVITIVRGAPRDAAATVDQLQIGTEQPSRLQMQALVAHLRGGPRLPSDARVAVDEARALEHIDQFLRRSHA